MTATASTPLADTHPEQRVAIVTGGARGIGAAVTTVLARAGVHVAAGYSANAKTAEELAGNSPQGGGQQQGGYQQDQGQQGGYDQGQQGGGY